MVSVCANPGCSARLKYFRDGKIYAFDKPRPGKRNTRLATEKMFFWLCPDCSLTVTLVQRQGKIDAVPVSNPGITGRLQALHQVA